MAVAEVTRHNVSARIAERMAKETAQIAEIAECAKTLASLRRMNLAPCNEHLLWAEWHFAKALHEWWQSDDSLVLFEEACDNLNVDRDGEPRGGAA